MILVLVCLDSKVHTAASAPSSRKQHCSLQNGIKVVNPGILSQVLPPYTESKAEVSFQ